MGPAENEETPMRQTELAESWVVYKMTLHGKQDPVNAICLKSEWDAMELARPGYHTLIRESIMDENQAERIARGTSGDAKKR
jgi:hypothetical protein